MPCWRKLVRQFLGVGAIQLGVVGARRFQAHPDGRDAQLHQFLVRVLANGVGGRKDVQRPTLAGLFASGASNSMARCRCSRKFSSMMKNDFTWRVLSASLHQAEQFVAGGIEVEDLPLAAEERRRGAEVATHGAAHRSNDGGRRIGLVRNLHSHHPQSEARRQCGMANGRVRVLAQVARASTRCRRPSRCGRRPGCARLRESPPRARPPRWWSAARACRTMRHISRALPTFTMMEEMPTMS